MNPCLERRGYVLFTLLALASSAGAQSNYVLVDPDPLNEIGSEFMTGFEDGDRLLGHGALGSTSGAVFGVSGAFHVVLPPAGLGYIYFMDQNSAGVAVGIGLKFNQSGLVPSAFWYDGSTATTLDSLVAGGSAMSLGEAYAINSANQVVGYGTLPSGPYHGFMLDGGVLHDLGSFAGPVGLSIAYGINDSGQVVGRADATGGYHAFRWENGIMTDWHDPSQIPGPFSAAKDIDRFGNACGLADFQDGQQYGAAYWSSSGAVENLGALPGSIRSEAIDKNDLGAIIGTAWLGEPYERGVLWKDGQIIDLNQFAPANEPIHGAIGINNDGTILVVQVQGVDRYRLLKPVCAGGSTTYGTGCSGTGGVTPALSTLNCPTPGNTFALTLENGQPHATTLLLLGTGTGSVPIVPTCALQILPLTSALAILTLDDDGALFLPVSVPAGIPSLTVSLQALCVDPGGSGGFASTAPLQLHVQ